MKGELIAWREWRLTEDNRLRSVSMDTVWDGPHMKAHAEPRMEGGAGRGLYFLRRRKHAMDYGGEVIGCAALYGHIVEHERGFRAQECMVRYLELHESVATPEKVTALEMRYGCTVKVGHWKQRTGVLTWQSLANGIYTFKIGDTAWTSAVSCGSSTSPTPTPSPRLGPWRSLCQNVGNWFLRRAS